MKHIDIKLVGKCQQPPVIVNIYHNAIIHLDFNIFMYSAQEKKFHQNSTNEYLFDLFRFKL